jgi:hypothetical protein
MEVTNTLISSLLAVNIIDIAVRELRIRRDAKETIKAIEKITLSNEDCVSKVKFLDKEFGELTSLMFGNKIHYDTMMDESTSRIDLMQVRFNKENMSLQSQIKEMEQHWSVQLRTLDNELQGIIRSVEKIKKESQFRVVPSSELFAIENLERQVQDLQERFNIVYEKDSVDIATLKKRGRPRKETISDANFDRVPAEELLNDATPIMDWANGKLHEESNELTDAVEQIKENVKSTPTRSKAIKKDVKKSLFTMKEIHAEIFRKKGMKWFTIRRIMGEEKYLHEFNKAYKRLYYYKFDATNSQNNKSTNSNEKNTTNYESIF